MTNSRWAARGFTLVELMVTIAVFVILASMAVPSLQSWVARTGMQTLQQDFQGAMTRARSEALARNTCVSLCQLKADSTSVCETTAANSGQWHKGWIIFENAACESPTANDYAPPATSVLAVRQPGNSRFQLNDSSNSGRAYFTYNASGLLRGQNDSLVLTDARNAVSPFARNLDISAQGRIHATLYDPTANVNTAAGKP